VSMGLFSGLIDYSANIYLTFIESSSLQSPPFLDACPPTLTIMWKVNSVRIQCWVILFTSIPTVVPNRCSADTVE
jgi:hypothetical protein